ncbi:hypothetical protein Q3G72_035615 [Acer saccharum]|nr:hypothetical protein Q3G72_035615 [Acer saccharum]
MLKRSSSGGSSISMLSNSSAAMLVGWCRGGGSSRRRQRMRRRGSTIRLGKKRRGFCLGSRRVVQWGVMLKKVIMEITPNGRFIDAYYLYLPFFIRPQIFPLC